MEQTAQADTPAAVSQGIVPVRGRADMTQDEIIRMAREAGLFHPTSPYHIDQIQTVERFAALIAAHEREACAKVCADRYMGDNNREDMEAKRCAAAIRARGEK